MPPTPQFAYGRTTNQSVSFDTPFSETPIVLLMPTIDSANPTTDGPSSVQLTSVSASGFHYAQAEPSGNDINAKAMTEIDWMAFAPGQGTLPDGHQYEAAIENISNYQAKKGNRSWQRINFISPFTTKPELFHQKQSQNNNCWLTSIANEKVSSYFELALEVSEVFDRTWWLGWQYECAPSAINLNHIVTEQLGWVAIEAHQGSFVQNGNTMVYQVGEGENRSWNMRQQCQNTNNFSIRFNAPPILIAKKKSRKGGDGGWLRRCNLTNSSFNTVVDEDQYQDSDRSHVNEDISFFALSAPQQDSLPGLRFESTQTDALTCDAHPVTVQALRDNQPDETFLGSINLTTSTGIGTWSLISGSGHFSPGNDDGQASYTFAATDLGNASFGLFHSLDGLIGLSVTDGPISDQLNITYRNFGFRTSLGSPLSIFTANTDNSITIHAVGKDDSSTACAQITSYDGNKNISFWSDYENPTQPNAAGTQLKVNGQEIANTSADASPSTINFSAGQASLVLNYPDAGQLKLNAKDAEGIAPPAQGGSPEAIIGGSSFIVNPKQLLFTQIESSGKLNPQGNASDANSDGFIPAGDHFNAKLQAVMDSTGLNCSEVALGLCVTPSFFHSNVLIDHQIKSPMAGKKGDLDGIKDRAAERGMVDFEDLSYTEVGSISLRADIERYLQLGNDLSVTSEEIGRFYPANILLQSSSFEPACNNTFTYLDQIDLKLDYVLHAVNREGAITENYHWEYYPSLGTFDGFAGDGVSNLTDRLNIPSSNINWKLGKYTVEAYQLGLDKLASPVGPFNDVTMALNFTGHDGETIPDLDFNPADNQCQTNNNCLGKTLGNAGHFYYGRLRPVNGFGSELSAISVSQRIERYNSATANFIVNDQDSCSQLATSAFTFAPDDGSGNMQIGSSSSLLSTATANSGLLPLTFSAPGQGNNGTGQFTIDLLNSLPWLRYDWSENDSPNDNVTGSITFGIYKSSERLIYRREKQ